MPGQDEVRAFRDRVFHAICESVDHSPVDCSGDGVHIGIVDSCKSPPAALARSAHIEHRRNFLEVDDHVTHIHGVAIFELLSAVAPQATFSFYQAIDSDKRLPTDSFTRAIHQAVDDGVDILNLSWGAPNGIPVECSPQYPPVKHAVENDVIVVAAAGNREVDDGPKQYVFSPALAEEAVAVGGFEALCPVVPSPVDNTTDEGPYCFEGDTRERSFCGHHGCDDSPSCVRSKTLREWPDNTRPLDGKPDILAPAHMPSPRDTADISGVELYEGSSYAAPVVAGALAGVFSKADVDTETTAINAHELVTAGSRTVSGAPAPALNSFGMFKRLESQVETSSQQ
ncbi:S8 family serine peptidase [Haloferax chudinovii]|uniref:S8 family serine peptidase n=1 Tax=Haloferax chudinovii TaxID=1109010 RepID=A0ABD5XJK7_9EURY